MNFNITLPPTNVGGWISLGIYAFAILSIFGGMVTGFRRGFTKTVIRIITILVAGIAAFVAVNWLFGAFDSLFVGKTLDEVILSVYSDYETAVDPKVREIIAAFDAETAELLIAGVVALILSPILFLIAFIIARIPLLLVDWLLGAIFGKSNKHKGAASTFFGGILGIAQGALVAIIVLIPFAGILTLAGVVKSDMIASENYPAENKADVESFYAEYLDDAIANPLVSIIYDNGGGDIYHDLSKARVSEESYDMTERATLVARVAVNAISLNGMDWKAPTAEQKEVIERIVQEMSDDDCTARLLAGILRGSSKALSDNIEIFQLEAPYDGLIKDAFAIFTTSDELNIGPDLDTMLQVYFIMADNEILTLIADQDIEGMKDKLTVKTDDELIVDKLINTLQANERTASLVTLFTKLSVSIMADQLGLGEDTVELYENIKDDFTEVLNLSRDDYETEEEYKEEVKTQLNTALEENGIVLEEEIINGMTDYVAENFSGNEEVTDEAINNAILSYYSAYLDYVNNGGEIPGDILDQLPGDISGVIDPNGNGEGNE